VSFRQEFLTCGLFTIPLANARGSDTRQANKLEPRVTESEPRVTESEPRVTELEPRVTESEPRVTELEPRVTESEPRALASGIMNKDGVPKNSV